MGTITKTHTFSAGATIIAAEHNTNFDTIYNEFNGSISNANISGSAAIVDTKLAQITTASKVSTSAITGTLGVANGGTGLASFTAGDLAYATASTTLAALAKGTAVQVLAMNSGATAPEWISGAVKDYGTSASSSTARALLSLKFAYGSMSLTTGASQQISNLAFTSNTSYFVGLGTQYSSTVNENCRIVRDSGAAFTIYNDSGATTVTHWIAIGV